jgi:hypothetical protein
MIYKQFGVYPDIHWYETGVTIKAFGKGDEFPTPNIKNFQLERCMIFPKDSEPNLILVGYNGTHISIIGPKSKLDILYKELKNYRGKSWDEITNIRLKE